MLTPTSHYTNSTSFSHGFLEGLSDFIFLKIENGRLRNKSRNPLMILKHILAMLLFRYIKKASGQINKVKNAIFIVRGNIYNTNIFNTNHTF